MRAFGRGLLEGDIDGPAPCCRQRPLLRSGVASVVRPCGTRLCAPGVRAVATAAAPVTNSSVEPVRCSATPRSPCRTPSMGPSVVGGLRSVEKARLVSEKCLGDVIVVRLRRP